MSDGIPKFPVVANFTKGIVVKIEPKIELGPDSAPPASLASETRILLSNGRSLELRSSHHAAIAFAFAFEYSRVERRA